MAADPIRVWAAPHFRIRRRTGFRDTRIDYRGERPVGGATDGGFGLSHNHWRRVVIHTLQMARSRRGDRGPDRMSRSATLGGP